MDKTPSGAKDVLTAAQVEAPPPPPATCTGLYYTVRSGDSLFLIGQRFGCTVTQMLAANPQITNPNLIFVGQVICVPRCGVGEAPPGGICDAGARRIEIIIHDTVSTCTALAVVPDPEEAIPPPPATCTGFYYTVRSGDSLFLIGQRFGCTITQMLAANPQITNPNLIFVGQVICVPQCLRASLGGLEITIRLPG
jgi:LysM repeat protein